MVFANVVYKFVVMRNLGMYYDAFWSERLTLEFFLIKAQI